MSAREQHETSQDEPETTSPFDDPSRLIQLYDIAVNAVSAEAERVWSRFNYIFAVNSALFVLYFVSRKELVDDRHYAFILTAISMLGLYLSFWAFGTLRGSWRWHRHFVHAAKDVESRFPPGTDWARLFRSREPARRRQTFSVMTSEVPGLFYGRTQPLMIAFCLAWLAALISSFVLLGGVILDQANLATAGANCQ